MKIPTNLAAHTKRATIITPFRRLALHSAVATAILGGGYTRGTYAGSCTAGGISVCSGAANNGIDSTQRLSNTPLTVSTTAGFGIDTTATGGDALHLTGTVAVTFTDTNSSSITGGDTGILAVSSGISGTGGAVSITTTGAVTGSNYQGIDARNYGRGILSIDSSGAVTSGNGVGIAAFNEGTDLVIKTGEVTAKSRGIAARNLGSGVLSITSSGAVTGSRYFGIYAVNSNGTDLTIESATVTGSQGIYARNYGSGSLTITSTGDVRGTSGQGISARNRFAGTDLIISTAAVHGGIYALHEGTGQLSITSSGDVSGDGIQAITSSFATGLSINAAGVSGSGVGVYARHRGAGALSITSSAAVSSWGYGMGASNGSSGTDLTLITGEVIAGFRGISAANYGSGALTITSTGLVKSTRESGIHAFNVGTNLSITATTVTGGYTGIAAINHGSGDLSITTSGVVSGSGEGIHAYNAGTGALSITSHAAVTGTDRRGIYAFNSDETTDLSLLLSADVSGGNSGIDVVQNGSGTLTITTGGVVNGGTGNALRLSRTEDGAIDGTVTNNGSLVSDQRAAVLFTSGLNFDGDFINNGDITGGNGVAFDASATANGIALNQTAGTITGDVLLGRGDDVVNITGGAVNGLIVGQGFGTVNIDVGAGNDFTGNCVVNVKHYVIRSGTVHQVADFSTAAATTTVNTGATLSFDSVINGAGALVSNGNLEFIVSPEPGGQLVQAGTVTLNAGSTITVSPINTVLNQSQQLISATSIVDNGVAVIGGSLLYDFEATITNTSVSVQSMVADLGGISPYKNPSAFGDSMTAFISAGGDNAVVDLLAELPVGDVQGFEQIADVFSPSVSGAVSQGALEANDSTWRLVNERFVGSESGERGGQPHNGLWLQGYGGEADQDSIDHVDGFDADTGGVAVGYDRDMGQWRVGAAFSSGETDVDNDRYASDSIDIESNQFLVYGGYWHDAWFTSATASYAALDYHFKRHNLIAGEGPIKGNTDGDLYGLSVSGGYRYVVHGVALTPQLALRYNSLSVDEYNEDGGLDLQVKYNDIDTLASELGVSASADYVVDDWQLSPIARLAWVHEYLGDREKATASYSGQSYQQEGFEPDADLASLGLGLEANNGQGLSIGIDYRGTLGSDYSRNQGWLNLRYEF